MVNIGGPGVLWTPQCRLWICVSSTPASAYLHAAQASGEGNHVFTSLGTETLKVPPHGTLSASSCLPSSLCSMSAFWSHC